MGIEGKGGLPTQFQKYGEKRRGTIHANVYKESQAQTIREEAESSGDSQQYGEEEFGAHDGEIEKDRLIDQLYYRIVSLKKSSGCEA